MNARLRGLATDNRMGAESDLGRVVSPYHNCYLSALLLILHIHIIRTISLTKQHLSHSFSPLIQIFQLSCLATPLGLHLLK